MKVLFINKYDTTGGAAIAAYRLQQSIREKHNTQNYILAGIKKSSLPQVIPTRNSGVENFLERCVNFFCNSIGLQYKYFPFSTHTIVTQTQKIRPDIISLHNIHGGYFKTSLLIELSKLAPIVWTLHDMWAFTANAAHTFGDTSWKKLQSGKDEKKQFPSIGINTGNWLLREKRRIYSESNFVVVTPSKWLYDLAIQSPVFNGKRIVHIPNGVDVNIFSLKQKNIVRKDLGILEEAKVILFNAEHLFASSYKGGKDFIEILQMLHAQTEEKIHLIIIGNSANETLQTLLPNFTIQQTGYISDEKIIVQYLNAADIFVYPTRADNLPNTLIEAIACGLPCVTFDVGGCREIIENAVNGFLVPQFDKQLFVEKIIELLRQGAMRKEFSINGRKIAEDRFSIDIVAEKYFNLFNSLSR